ncbi:lachesin-like isoform X1 [Varroa jacobsoni]|nr:lachesin-like isoform X1 [Varroa jacobsoni]
MWPTSVVLLVVMAKESLGIISDDELSSQSYTPKPRFVGSVKNRTAALGREASLECSVENLGNYKVTWIKMDTETLLTFHTTIIAGENRLRVSHNNARQWYLHIKNVQLADKGAYMCQINSQPMINQVGYLDVLIPPSIVTEGTMSEVNVHEGQNATLRCKAHGYPTPTITWRRENGKDISLLAGPAEAPNSAKTNKEFGSIASASHPHGISSKKKLAVAHVSGEELSLVGVKREESGAYLCIAKNGVTPTVSQRVKLLVNFGPRITVNRTDIGAMKGNSARLECFIEASPRPDVVWLGASGVRLNSTHNNGKYTSTFSSHWYTHRYELVIYNVTNQDYGQYQCQANNPFGNREAIMRVYEIKRPTVRPKPTRPSTTTALSTWRSTPRWFAPMTIDPFIIPEGIETANEVPREDGYSHETSRKEGKKACI